MSLDDDIKSALQSKTVWGGIIAFIATVTGAVFHFEYPAGFETEVATSLAGLFGAGLAIYGRIKAVKKIG